MYFGLNSPHLDGSVGELCRRKKVQDYVESWEFRTIVQSTIPRKRSRDGLATSM